MLLRRSVLHTLTLHHNGAAATAGHSLGNALMQRCLLGCGPLLLWGAALHLDGGMLLWCCGRHLEQALAPPTAQLDLAGDGRAASLHPHQLLPLGRLDLEVLVLLLVVLWCR